MPASIKSSLKKEILALKEGIRLGRPQDVLIDRKKHRVAAVLLARSDVPQLKVAVHGKKLRSFEEDILTIADLNGVSLGHQDQDLLDTIQENKQFEKTDVYSQSGRNLGKVVDALLDDSGGVTEYLVARGRLQRLLGRLTPIKPSELRAVGEDVAVAANSVAAP